MMSEQEVRPKLLFWSQMSSKQTQKNLSSRTPLNGKKTCQALELPNDDVPARSQAQIMMLGQDEWETDMKNRTSMNSASKLTNPLEMVKKNNLGF